MRVGILGPVAVWRDGAVAGVAGARLRTLLALLALRAGRAVPAADLVEGLWEDGAPAGGANALQSLVSRLRGQLGPDAPIESRQGGYALAVPPDDVDAGRFRRLAAEGRAALDAERAEEAAAALAGALALWRGDALADAGDAPSLRAAAQTLERERLAATEARVDAELACGRHATVIVELEDLVAAHPLNERLRGLLMRALYGAGRHADALALYERTRRTLAEELGVDPSPELQSLHVAMLRRSPALDAHAAPRTNLRAPLTSFVGRDEDLAHVAALLEASRLVTLTGPGGAGKTRLASELAGRVAGRFPHGVWMVELAPIADPGSLPDAVLAALGVGRAMLSTPGAQQAETSRERMLETLADRAALLVLDNCEHLVEGCAELADAILAACPGCRILATSREPLGIAGEACRPISSLDGDAAVRLFLDRAAHVRPDADPGGDGRATVARICGRLDGMPLAIELAAARTRTLSVAQIEERLEDRFGLLVGGSRTALARHQTLRAVVDWSWDLLPPPEQTLLRRLAAFAGGVELDVAERVCAGDGLAAGAVLGALSGLVDKSLVEAAPAAERMRYRLLETVRAYAAERLAESGEEAAVRGGHARCYAELAEAMDAALHGAGQPAALEWFDRERDNLGAARRWAVRSGDATLALRLTVPAATYWAWRGRREESREAFRAVLAMEGDADPWLRATAHVHRAFSGFEASALADIQADLARARALFEESGRRPHHALLSVEPMLEMIDGRAEDAARAAERLTADPDADDWTRANAYMTLGHVLNALGERDRGRRAYETAIARFRAMGELWGRAQALAGLAAATLDDDPVAARAALEEALELGRRLGMREDVANILTRLGALELKQGNDAAGEAMIEEAMRIAHDTGSPEALAGALFFQAAIARQLEDLPRARRLFEEAVAMSNPGDFPPFRPLALVGLGYVAELQGDPDEAERHHRRAMDAFLEMADGMWWRAYLLAHAVEGLAGVALARGDAELAARLLGAARSLRGADVPLGDDRLDADRIAAATTEALGADVFERAYGRGRAMTPADAIDLARGGGPDSRA